MMLIIGLTGSMGTGKSTLINRIHQNFHWPIWDADHEVQQLYDQPDVIHQISAAFPESLNGNNKLSRSKLRKIISLNPAAVDILEDILHPLLAQNRHCFLMSMKRLSQLVVVLDIPLLFEKGIDQECDITVVTSCPFWLQKQRILSRPGMTKELMQTLLSKQFSLEEKKILADIVVETGLSKRHSWSMLKEKLSEYTNVPT